MSFRTGRRAALALGAAAALARPALAPGGDHEPQAVRREERPDLGAQEPRRDAQ